MSFIQPRWTTALLKKLNVNLELEERMRDLKNELRGFEGEEYDEIHKKKAIEALKRMENWNLFSDTPEVTIRFFCCFDGAYR